MCITEVPLHVEVLLTPATSSPSILPSPELTLLQTTIENTLKSRPTCETGVLPLQPPLTTLVLPTKDATLRIASIHVTLSEDDACHSLPSWQITPIYHLFTHHDSPSITPPPGASVTPIPSLTLRDWSTLHFKQPLKSTTLSYMLTRRTHDYLPSSGFILLHGAPGTGKSSLAEAAAQKMAIRSEQGYLLRLTSECLSKYFGESANRVAGVFQWALVTKGVVVIVIDEIESFGLCRSTSDGGDSIRVTNALLTGLDAIRGRGNITVIGTSNHVESLDAAIRDRADLCMKVCEMGAGVRGVVLKGTLKQLVARGVLDKIGNVEHLLDLCQGISARRIEGSVVVALGLSLTGIDVEWHEFEQGLRKALKIAGGTAGGITCGYANGVAE